MYYEGGKLARRMDEGGLLGAIWWWYDANSEQTKPAAEYQSGELWSFEIHMNATQPKKGNECCKAHSMLMQRLDN